MRAFRCLAVLVVAALGAEAIQAAEPVVVDLNAETKVQFAIVTIGDVAQVSGGDAAIREQIARMDIAEVKPREQTLTIKRQVLEYRLRLAGIDPADVVMTGADRTTVSVYRRTVTADEVVAAARSELFRWLSVPRETITIELARPVVVRLPEVPAGDSVTISAVPHAKTATGLGRVQMDVVITTGTEKLLALGVDLEVKPVGRPTDPVVQVSGVSTLPNITLPALPRIAPAATTPNPVIPASGTTPINSTTPVEMPQPNSRYSKGTATTPTAVIVHQRQRVMMQIQMGGLNVTAAGEAQQDGRLGQTILVQNVESKKTVTARVTGPGTVEIELETHQP